jgi:hypothetical protein
MPHITIWVARYKTFGPGRLSNVGPAVIRYEEESYVEIRQHCKGSPKRFLHRAASALARFEDCRSPRVPFTPLRQFGFDRGSSPKFTRRNIERSMSL